MQIFIFRKY